MLVLFRGALILYVARRSQINMRILAFRNREFPDGIVRATFNNFIAACFEISHPLGSVALGNDTDDLPIFDAGDNDLRSWVCESGNSSGCWTRVCPINLPCEQDNSSGSKQVKRRFEIKHELSYG
jgi:hypothetical protein